MTNNTVTEVNLHGNWLNDEFASDLGELLKENPILYKVDISQNPIGNDGALKLLDDLNSKNDTLNSLGDLSQNVLMGVKVRKDIEDALWLNSVSSRAKQSKLKIEANGRGKNFLEIDQMSKSQSMAVQSTLSEQQRYVLLKPITFSNVVDDDYTESNVWHIRKQDEEH